MARLFCSCSIFWGASADLEPVVSRRCKKKSSLLITHVSSSSWDLSGSLINIIIFWQFYTPNSNSPRSLHFSDRCEIATAQCRVFPEKKFSISLGTSQPVPAYCAPFILCPKAIGSYLSHIEWNYARFFFSPSQSCIFWGWSFLTCASVVHNVRKDLKVCAPVCQFIVVLVHRDKWIWRKHKRDKAQVFCSKSVSSFL